MRKKITISDIFGIIILLTILDISFYMFVNTNFTNTKNPKESTNASLAPIENKIEELPQDVLDLESIKELQLQYNNDEIIGLLYIPETNIKEPIAQTENNDYYLKHDLYKNDNIQGAVFLDYRTKINKDKKNLIYSHNSQRYEVPFRELEGYYDKTYYDNHQYIYLKSINEIAKYQIFSIYVETSDWEYTKINFENKHDWFQHIKYLKDKSWYETNVDITNKDKILILQTCSNHNDYENYENKYLLIISKRVN